MEKDTDGLSRVANALGRMSGGAVKPQSGTASDLDVKSANIDQYRKMYGGGATLPDITRPATGTRPLPAADRINPKARYGDRPGEKRIDTTEMTKPLPSYEEGTDDVPEDGPAMLHKGEAVLNKDDAKDMRESKGVKRVSKTLGGAKPKDKKEKLSAKKGVTKKAHKIVARKAAGGGVVLEHHYDSGKPELHFHPDAESAADQMKEHMSDEAGEEAGAPQGVPGGAGMAQPSSFKDGGKVKKSGMAMVHKGEEVISAKKPSPDKDMVTGP